MKRNIFAKLFIFIMLFMLNGCAKADYSDSFAVTDITPIIDGVENKLQIEYELKNNSKREDMEFCISIDGVTEEYFIEPEETESGMFVFDLEKPSDNELEYDTVYEVKRKDKSVWTKEDKLVVDCTEILAAWEIDYSGAFSVTQILPVMGETDNEIQIDYKIKNVGKRDDLRFCLTVNGETIEKQLKIGGEEASSFLIDIGKPTAYNLSYPAKYEVKYQDESLWSKEEAIQYDCSELFHHNATIRYNEESASVKLADYQTNSFSLSELFSSFDENIPHNVNMNTNSKDRGKIGSADPSAECKAVAASGNTLHVFTYGKMERNDTYRFSDDLEIIITDTVTAASVNWEENMVFLDEADTKTLYGITTVQMKVKINNISDEDILGTLVDFYVNDKKIAKDYLVGSDRDRIYAGGTGNVSSFTSANVWLSTGVKTVKKFGMHIKLEDKQGNILYDGIQWLDLK